MNSSAGNLTLINNDTTTISPMLTDFSNSSWTAWDWNSTQAADNHTTTPAYQLRHCEFKNGGWECPVAEDTSMDPYLIVAIVCFSLGGLLLIIGVLRLVWFFYSPRKDHRKFKYILRLLEAKEKGTHGYNDYVDNPALWY